MKVEGEGKILRVIFAKKGNMKYISHLDLARLFHRAARRAGITVALSKGFSPRLKIIFKRALKLGLESEAEEAVFELSSSVSLEDFRSRLQSQFPEGIVIKHIEVIG